MSSWENYSAFCTISHQSLKGNIYKCYKRCSFAMLKATTLKGHSVIAFSLPPLSLSLCTLRVSSTFCSCCNDFSSLVRAHACVWTWNIVRITKESRSECAFTLSLSCLARIPVHNYLRIHSHYLLLKTIFYTLSHAHTHTHGCVLSYSGSQIKSKAGAPRLQQ